MPTAQRIAFVCPRFSESGTVGGAETLLKNLALRAAAAGREVTFLTTCAESHITWENARPPGHERVGLIDVDYFTVDHRDLPVFNRTQTAICRGGTHTEADEESWIRNSVNSTPLYDFLNENLKRFDCIVTGPYLFGVTFFASQIAPWKTLLVPCLHDEPFAHLSLMKRLFERVAGFMFNTEPERDLARRLFTIPEERCSVVGMGIDPFETRRGAFAAEQKITAPYIMYSGRREDGKGTPLICDYLHTFRERSRRDVKLVFTGRGDITAPPQLWKHIIDLGFVSDGEKHAAMADALAFIHPSVFESLGIVLLESWMAGTPALVHAKSEVLRWQCQRSNAGLWFRSYPEFEKELTLLLDNTELRDALGRNGRAYVEKEYAWASVEKRLFAAVDGVAAKGV